MKFCLIVRIIWCQLTFAVSLVSGLAHVTHAQTIQVDIRPGHSTNTFKPTEALGAGVDRIPLAATDKIFTEPVLKQILSTGWQTVSYRQNTELYVEACTGTPKARGLSPVKRAISLAMLRPRNSFVIRLDIRCRMQDFRSPTGAATRVLPTATSAPTGRAILT